MENTVEKRDDELELEETPVEEVEEVESDEVQSEDEESIEEDDNEEVIYTFGEGSQPQEDDDSEVAELPRKLRGEIRERNKRIKELEEQLNANKPKEQATTLGSKPTFEECDYDEELYSRKLEEWHNKKLDFDKKQAEIKKAEEAQAQEWMNTLNRYTERRDSFKASDFEEAEEIVMDIFSETQQGMLLQGASNSAELVYALGKNPAKAKELASIKDPVKFAWAASKLEGSMKTNKRKPSSAPEKTVRGSGTLSGTTDSTLNRLRAEADKTGDYSKVIAYKKQK